MKKADKPTHQKTVRIQCIHGKYHLIAEDTIINAAQRCITKKLRGGKVLSSTKLTREYVQLKLGTYEQEVFLVIFLDSRHRLIEAREMFFGTIDGANIYPREVVKAAMSCNAAAVIFAHNHPSGASDPSQADIKITETLQCALGYVDVRVLDHLIVGEHVTSMAEHGLLA